MDEFDEGSDSRFLGLIGFFANVPPSVKAALMCAIPFIFVDFFNYYTAGTALIISTPILAIIYTCCGALAGKFASDHGTTSRLPVIGASAGLALWLVSTVINTIISLVIGAASLGATLLLGVPYLCLCAPIQLIGGGLMGALGGFLFGFFSNRSSNEVNNDIDF